MDGRPLTFRLAGINNQNFIMRDEETGSWWQQVSGECILGPLKGRRLKQVYHDELTFARWRGEGGGRVLRPDPQIAAKGRGGYVPADWEQSVARMPVATTLPDNGAGPLEPRALVVGVEAGGAAKAYPFESLARQNPIIDTIGGVPVLLLLADDGKSVRAFERTVDGRPLEFFVSTEGGAPRLLDAETGTRWDFTGEAVEGPLAGRRLTRITALKDYWFDWKAYHPDTSVYLLGDR